MAKGLIIKGRTPDIIKASDNLKAKLPLLIANLSKNHFLEGFRKGGGQTDASRGGWEQRKKPKGKRAKRREQGRNILVDTGQLRNDIDVRRTTFQEIVIGTLNVKYGIYHNEGTEKHPQREFLGDSRGLMSKIGKLAVKEFNKEFKK